MWIVVDVQLLRRGRTSANQRRPNNVQLVCTKRPLTHPTLVRTWELLFCFHVFIWSVALSLLSAMSTDDRWAFQKKFFLALFNHWNGVSLESLLVDWQRYILLFCFRTLFDPAPPPLASSLLIGRCARLTHFLGTRGKKRALHIWFIDVTQHQLL